jgi:hypothetical protein
MIRSFNLRSRCAAASTRASDVLEPEPLDFEAWLLEVERADDDARVPVLFRVELPPRDELAEDRRPDVPFPLELDLEPPLLACGMCVSLCGLRGAFTPYLLPAASGHK